MTLPELAKRTTLYVTAITVTAALLLGMASLVVPIIADPVIKDATRQAVDAEHARALGREEALAEQIGYLREDIRDLTAEIHHSDRARR